MIHEEWIGDKELIEKLLLRSGLIDTANAGELKLTMRWIIWYKYVDLMTVDESLARLYFEHNIDITSGKYYRILNKAVKILERYI